VRSARSLPPARGLDGLLDLRLHLRADLREELVLLRQRLLQLRDGEGEGEGGTAQGRAQRDALERG
jgi:hypothetical protein